MIGKTLGHYHLLEKLGQGGIGVVCKAQDTHLERQVALKLLPPEKVADGERKRRFVREAKCASALNHPNIVTIYDIDHDAGIDFIAMEYVDGQTLARPVPPSGLRADQVLKYAAQVAGALAAAHSAGIIHRDLKPANVMVTGGGLVKVLDFGLAKLSEPSRGGLESMATAQDLTAVDAVVGTAPYMSPEQIEGRELDTRSDIFSFGAMFYEMLAEAHASLGVLNGALLWDWRKAESAFERSIELNPNYAPAHLWNACFSLAPAGRLEEAAREAERSIELEPLVPIN